MRISRAFVTVLVMAVAAYSAVAASASAPSVGNRVNFDLYLTELVTRPLQDAVATPADARQSWQYDRRLGLPTFLWARADEAVPAVGALQPQALLEARAREYLRGRSQALHLNDRLIADAELVEAQYNGAGPAVVRFRQRVGGVEVFNRYLSVMMDRSGRLVAISGYFASAANTSGSGTFVLDASQAIAAAWVALGGTLDAGALSLAETRGAYQLFNTPAVAGHDAITRPPRVKAVYYPRLNGLEAGYYVELFATSRQAGNLAYSFVISALDGRLLFRNNLTAYDAYTYRVFADAASIKQPFDAPLGNSYAPSPGLAHTHPPRVGVPSVLVTLDHGPITTGDPWLAAAATTTTGNNADAFLDSGLILGQSGTSGATDGYQANSGDVRTAPTSANTFDYPIQADDDPSSGNGQQAAIVNLFYMNNWLHDWWYDHGFNEVAGNAQTSNYGRGGAEGDAISAQGQDASGRNNANMATPGDGSSPTMQMYLFDGIFHGEVRVTAPYDSGPLAAAGASFGPSTFDLTGTVAIANDGEGASNTDGCGAASTPPDPILGLSETPAAAPDPGLTGKIALIDRGLCFNTTKEQFATASGAVAMLNVNNGDGDPSAMGNGDVPIDVGVSSDQVYTLPAVRIRKDDGQKIKDAIAAGQTVTVHLQRTPSIDFDGTFDEQVIAHEFFHHVSNRLVGNGNGLGNSQGGGMGEGWSDVNAMLLTVRPEDRDVAGNDRYQAPYALAYYVTNDFYYGIRRTPYSTDFSKDPLTFKHIENGVPLPSDQAPIAFGVDGSSNAEVHNSGEVWANMVWNCYVGLLNDPRHSFEEARSRMQDYFIAGLKATPVSPTFTEARDGILAAAMAKDMGDYASCGHGFAKRGIGKNAQSPPRNDTNNAGVVESYDEFVEGFTEPVPGSPQLPDAGGAASARDNTRFGGSMRLATLAALLLGAGLRRRPRSS